jgi:N-acetylneuraminate synthase
MYPTPPEKLGLNLIPAFRERYGCKVGLSDHSGTIYAGLAAAALSADAVEVHVTLSRDAFGPDVSSSLTIQELRRLVEGTRFIERALNHPVAKDELAKDLSPLRDLFTKSVVAETDLPAGTFLEERHLSLKKPGTGIPASRVKDLVGRRLKHEIKADTLLLDEDLD